jgi:HD-GYP domain-containing protein (c-di-GMP phosphodiesterase class II)
MNRYLSHRDWPDNFDVRTDPVLQSHFRPFIDLQMAALKDLDRQRAAHISAHLPPEYQMTYIFHEHAARVAEDMRRTALYMGLPEHVTENLYWAMLPHDIGKAALPADLWDSMDKPTDAVKAQRRSHTVKGAEIAEAAGLPDHPFRTLMLDIMRNHHEQMDGNGFLGLNGDQLSLPARLACIVESYDGYAIARPHFGDRDITPAGVLARMRNEKGNALYDMELFGFFEKMKLESSKNI